MSKWTKAVDTEWAKLCPKCEKVMYYSSKGNLNKAIVANRSCMNCKNDFTEEYREKISAALKGRSTKGRCRTPKTSIHTSFIRTCPSCINNMMYARRDLMLRAAEQNTVCNSCSSKIYKKSWTHVIKDEHVKKMAARKAGYDTFDDYMADLATKKQYAREVRRITRKQDISTLENFDKLRGLCGVDGAYQLDHIISVKQGYVQGISSEVIGNISNLQIIPWRDNLLKSDNDLG